LERVSLQFERDATGLQVAYDTPTAGFARISYSLLFFTLFWQYFGISDGVSPFSSLFTFSCIAYSSILGMHNRVIIMTWLGVGGRLQRLYERKRTQMNKWEEWRDLWNSLRHPPFETNKQTNSSISRVLSLALSLWSPLSRCFPPSLPSSRLFSQHNRRTSPLPELGCTSLGSGAKKWFVLLLFHSLYDNDIIHPKSLGFANIQAYSDSTTLPGHVSVHSAVQGYYPSNPQCLNSVSKRNDPTFINHHPSKRIVYVPRLCLL